MRVLRVLLLLLLLVQQAADAAVDGETGRARLGAREAAAAEWLHTCVCVCGGGGVNADIGGWRAGPAGGRLCAHARQGTQHASLARTVGWSPAPPLCCCCGAPPLELLARRLS